MADVVNKTTMEYRKSVHTPNYSDSEWWINPVLPSCEQKYWRNNNGVLDEMTIMQKADADQAEQDRADEVQAEILIQDKIAEISRQDAIDELVSEGKLNSDGTLIK